MSKKRFFCENFAENGKFRGREIIKFASAGSVLLVQLKIYLHKKIWIHKSKTQEFQAVFLILVTENFRKIA